MAISSPISCAFRTAPQPGRLRVGCEASQPPECKSVRAVRPVFPSINRPVGVQPSNRGSQSLPSSRQSGVTMASSHACPRGRACLSVCNSRSAGPSGHAGSSCRSRCVLPFPMRHSPSRVAVPLRELKCFAEQPVAWQGESSDSGCVTAGPPLSSISAGSLQDGLTLGILPSEVTLERRHPLSLPSVLMIEVSLAGQWEKEVQTPETLVKRLQLVPAFLAHACCH